MFKFYYFSQQQWYHLTASYGIIKADINLLTGQKIQPFHVQPEIIHQK